MSDAPKSAYMVTDANGNPWGPFDKATTAAEWATKKWPDQKEAVGDEYGNLVDGWTVWPLRHPDT